VKWKMRKNVGDRYNLAVLLSTPIRKTLESRAGPVGIANHIQMNSRGSQRF